MVACGGSKGISQEAEENGCLRTDVSTMDPSRSLKDSFSRSHHHDNEGRVTRAQHFITHEVITWAPSQAPCEDHGTHIGHNMDHRQAKWLIHSDLGPGRCTHTSANSARLHCPAGACPQGSWSRGSSLCQEPPSREPFLSIALATDIPPGAADGGFWQEALRFPWESPGWKRQKLTVCCVVLKPGPRSVRMRTPRHTGRWTVSLGSDVSPAPALSALASLPDAALLTEASRALSIGGPDTRGASRLSQGQGLRRGSCEKRTCT